ncbi:MAG: hypothetical protein NXH85_03480 [Pseudomonadaceae bacterium]|nr:hypothetical protein [Pseudomonadaceae bacterium]
MLKKVALGVLLLMVAFLAYRYAVRGDINASVIEEIQTNPTGELAAKTMLVTLGDGRRYPVNYLREDGLVFMGIDGRWWREFQGSGQAVDLYIQGEELAGHAIVVLDKPDYVDDIFSRLRPKVPAWLPEWLNGKLVVITPD